MVSLEQLLLVIPPNSGGNCQPEKKSLADDSADHISDPNDPPSGIGEKLVGSWKGKLVGHDFSNDEAALAIP